MGLRYPDQKFGSWFFVSTTFKDWQRHCDLPGFPERLCEALLFCMDKYATLLAAYVFMPHHIHLVLGIVGTELGNFMRDFKKYTGRKVAQDFGLSPSIWMPRYDRVVIVSESVMQTKVNYIHDNPVKDGLVNDRIDWKWSSARDYYTDETGPIPVFKSWK